MRTKYNNNKINIWKHNNSKTRRSKKRRKQWIEQQQMLPAQFPYNLIIYFRYLFHLHSIEFPNSIRGQNKAIKFNNWLHAAYRRTEDSGSFNIYISPDGEERKKKSITKIVRIHLFDCAVDILARGSHFLLMFCAIVHAACCSRLLLSKTHRPQIRMK